jgi:hypothetical protein
MKRVVTFLVTACPVVIAACAATAGGDAGPGGDIKAKVHALVQQMETGTSEGQRAEAEWALLKLGPDAMAYLPKPDAASGGIKDRLTAVWATLEEMQPRTWTVDSGDMSLDDALKRLKETTKLTLRDLRLDKSNSRVHVDFRAASYWQVVQALAAQTKARISLYQPDGQVALVDGPGRDLPVSLHGPFRVAFKRVATAVDLDTGTHICLVTLEIAWEPRFFPYLIEPGAATLNTFKDNRFATETPRGAALPVLEHNAKEIELRFTAPPRTAERIDELRGRFVITTPITQHRFEFKNPKGKTQKGPDGVQVTLNDVTTQPERWTVELTVEHPTAAPQFDSFQKWLGSKTWVDSSTCTFERGVGENLEVLRPDPLRTQLVSATANRVTVRYQFLKNNPGGVPLENVESWTLVCRTPGRMVEMTVPYAFRDLPLP